VFRWLVNQWWEWRYRRATETVEAFWIRIAARRPDWSAAYTHQFVHKAITAINDDLVNYFEFNHTEADILRRRLARRYDPGMAMNEAYARATEAVKNDTLEQEPPTTPPFADQAINQYYENLRKNPVQLTAQQKQALAVQRQTLRRNLEQ